MLNARNHYVEKYIYIFYSIDLHGDVVEDSVLGDMKPHKQGISSRPFEEHNTFIFKCVEARPCPEILLRHPYP
jgi:hypothetical protein